MSLHHSTAAELGRGLAARQYSSVEVTRHFLDRIGRTNASLNAFVTVTAERALEDARRADARIARGEGGPLTGVPSGAKRAPWHGHSKRDSFGAHATSHPWCVQWRSRTRSASPS